MKQNRLVGTIFSKIRTRVCLPEMRDLENIRKTCSTHGIINKRSETGRVLIVLTRKIKINMRDHKKNKYKYEGEQGK